MAVSSGQGVQIPVKAPFAGRSRAWGWTLFDGNQDHGFGGERRHGHPRRVIQKWSSLSVFGPFSSFSPFSKFCPGSARQLMLPDVPALLRPATARLFMPSQRR